jgi:long-subunit acyl-CoA synthetase (AMP-forming)
LEAIYSQSSYVEHIFITAGDVGKYQQEAVIAVVVPQENSLKILAQSLHLVESTRKQLCENKIINEKVLQIIFF